MLASVKVNMTIICACVPSLKPLADRFMPRMIRDIREDEPTASQEITGGMMTILTTPIGRQPEDIAPYLTVFGVSNYKPASLPRLDNEKSLRPVIFVNVLFILWGVGYGFLATVSPKFIIIANLSEVHDLGIRAAYWIGYLLSPLIMARPMLKSLGYRVTFITSLLIYSCGTLIF